VKIAVTGGSGFVGRHLVQRLLKDNHEISILSRHKPKEDCNNSKVRQLFGSVNEITELVPAIQDCEVVFHLVGIIAETRKNTFEKTVAEGTKNVVEACRLAHVKRIIYLSALGTSEKAETAYHRTKYKAEETIKNSGIDWVIFRSSIIYGKDDGFLTLMTKIIKMLPIVPIFGDGKYKMQPIFINDLTQAMAQAAQNQRASKKIIDAGGPEELEYVSVMDHIKRALGKKRLNFHIPFAVIRPVAALMETLLKPAPLTKDQLTMLKMGSVGDISLMKSLFEIEPIKFEDGLIKIFGEK